MTAPLFHLEPGALAGASAGAEVVFDGAEARHAALVNHEGIANVFDYGEE